MNEPYDRLTENSAGMNAGRLLVTMLENAENARTGDDAAAKRAAEDTANALMDRIADKPELVIQADTTNGRVTAGPWDENRSYPAAAYCHHKGTLYRATVTTRGNHPERTGAWLSITSILQRGYDASAAVDPLPEAPAKKDYWDRLRRWCGWRS